MNVISLVSYNIFPQKKNFLTTYYCCKSNGNIIRLKPEMMKNYLTILLLFAVWGNLSAQNEKVDSLEQLIEAKELEIKNLKEQIVKEIQLNGYTVKVQPKYSFTKVVKLKNSGDYGATVIDTIPIGTEILVFENSISYYKVRYGTKIGYVSSSDLDVDDSPVKMLPFTSSRKSGTSSSSISNYKSSHKSSYKSSSSRSSSGCSSRRCSGRTQKGSRCKRNTTNCSGRCHSH